MLGGFPYRSQRDTSLKSSPRPLPHRYLTIRFQINFSESNHESKSVFWGITCLGGMVLGVPLEQEGSPICCFLVPDWRVFPLPFKGFGQVFILALFTLHKVSFIKEQANPPIEKLFQSVDEDKIIFQKWECIYDIKS